MTKPSLKKPISVLLVTVVSVIFGIIALNVLPVALLPNINIPGAGVWIGYPNVSANDIEDKVAKPLESVFQGLEGIDRVESHISRDGVFVWSWFAWGETQDDVVERVTQAVNRTRGELPRDIDEPHIYSPGSGIPTVMFKIGSTERPLEELARYVEDTLLKQVHSVPDLQKSEVSGGTVPIVAIDIDQQKLAAYGLSLPDIERVMVAGNRNVPAGFLDIGRKRYMVRAIGSVDSIDKLANTYISLSSGKRIRIGDLGEIHKTTKPKESMVITDGEPGVLLSLFCRSDGNEVLLAKEAKKLISSFPFPPDISASVVFDSSESIQRALGGLKISAFIGAILAIALIFLFLGSVRNSAVIAISIPISIVITFAIMNALGMTLNMISIGGLTLAIGMIVDASIVVLENCFRYFSDPGLRKENRLETVYAATKEVRLPVIASILTSVVVFLPLAFTKGLAAVYLGDLAITVVSALLVSGIVALTIVPLLAKKWVNPISEEKLRRGALGWFHGKMERLRSSYQSAITWSLKNRWKVVGVATAAFISGIVAISFVSKELIPEFFDDIIRVSVRFEPGVSIDAVAKAVLPLEPKIREVKGIKRVTTNISKSSGRFEITLVDSRDRDVVANRVMALMPVIPGAEIDISTKRAHGGMGSGEGGVELVVYGFSSQQLKESAQILKAELENIRGIININIDEALNESELQVHIDDSKAHRHNVDPGAALSTIYTAMIGKKVSTYMESGTDYDVVLRLERGQVQDVNQLSSMLIKNSNNKFVPLNAIATLDFNETPRSISRENGKRKLSLFFDIEGRQKGRVIADAKKKLSSIPLPPGASWGIGGENRFMAESFKSLIQALIMAVLLVFMVMGMQFGSIIQPLIICSVIPLSLIGVAFGLLFTGSPLNLNSMLGLILLVGIVVNNAIILIDYINTMRRSGKDVTESVIASGMIRFRPIMITTLTTMLAMVPVALGLGRGGATLRPLGISVFFGLGVASLITLVLIPSIYSLVDEYSLKVKEWRVWKRLIQAGSAAIFIFLFSTTLYAAKDLTVNHAVETALKNNFDIKAQEFTLQSAVMNQRAGWSMFIPRLDGIASHTRFEFSDPVPKRKDLWESKLVLSYDVWKWGRDLNTYKILTEQKYFEEKQLTDDQEAVVRGTQVAFFTVILNKERLAIEQSNLKQQEEQLAITKARYRDGRLSKYDLLTVQVKLEEARSQLLSKEQELEKSVLELLTIMAEPLDTQVDIKGELIISPVSETVKELVDIAMEGRQDIIGVRSQKRIAQLNKVNSMVLFLPVVDVKLLYGFGSSEDPFLTPKEDESLTVMTSLSVPLFDGLSSFHKMRSSIADYYRNDVLEKKIIQQVEFDVRYKYLELKKTLEEIKVREGQVLQAKEAYSIAQKQYETGIRSTVELTEAQQNFIEAKFQLVQAKFQYLVSKIDLDKTVGRAEWKSI